MAKKRDWRLLGMAAIGVLVIAAIWPGKQGKILSVQYVDGEALVGLNNATLGLGSVDVVVYYMNTSSDPMDTNLTIELVDQDGVPIELQSLTGLDLHPNVEEPGTFTVTLGTEGDYTLNVTLYEEGTMAKLASKTVSFSAVEPVGPAEFVLSDSVIPDPVLLGDYTVASVTATNIGGEGGNCTVTIERTGRLPATSSPKFITAGQSESFGWGWKPTIVGTNTVEFIGPTNSLSGTFEVTEEPTPPEAAGTVLDIMVYIGDEWTDMADLEFDVGETITIGVFWQSDMTEGESDVIGDVVLEATDPDGTVTYPTAANGTNNQQLSPGGTSLAVEFDIPLAETEAESNAWSLTAGGDVNFPS